jgi:cellulose synthase/poly-beta-1,6-N-acetylglucosamine synthase-like glycosyltransferase
MIEMLYAVNWFILWYLIITSIGYIVLLAASIPDVMLRFKEEEVGNIITMLRTHSLPPITIITPFYNEKEILDSVYSILNSSYSNMNLLLVNDGSTDATLKKLIQAFDMHKVAPIIPERIKTWGHQRILCI